MSKLSQMLRCPNGFSVCFIIATLVFIGLLLFWQAASQYNQFFQHQQQLTKQSVNGAANEISAYVDHLRHQVKIFSQDRIAVLRQLTNTPENDKLFEQLTHDAAAYFPNYFAITIADAQGIPVLGNYDLLVNELCQADIKNFARSGFNYDIFIHPHPEVQHFDVMTPIKHFALDDTDSSGVFFISFKPTSIQRFLGNAQIFGHNLYLLKNNIAGLVELTADGTRVDLIKQNKGHILSEQALESVEYSIPVKGTRWNLASIADSTLYAEQKQKIARRAILIFLVFLFISLVYLALLKRLENRRKQSDAKLRQAKEQLQHTLNFSGVGSWEYNFHNKRFVWSDDAQSLLACQPPASLADYLAHTQLEDRPAVKKYFNECIGSGLALELEHRITCPDGITHWIELSGSIDTDGHPPARLLGLIRDVTTRKQAEFSLLQDEKQQRDTLIREVHHRIKNNLQGVIGLLRRHSNKGELSQTILEHAISQLNSVSLIHGLSGETNGGKIILSELIAAIIKAANNFTGSDIKPKKLPTLHDCYICNEDSAVAIALIINELIFNAIKHSPTSSNPKIELECLEHTATLTISNQPKQVNTNFNYDKNIGLGAGLNLIKSLLPKKGAKLSIKRQDSDIVTQLSLNETVIATYHDNNRTKKQIA